MLYIVASVCWVSKTVLGSIQCSIGLHFPLQKGVHGRCKVKAAGGISTVEDMEKFLALGADRLGTSRAVKLLNGEQAKGY